MTSAQRWEILVGAVLAQNTAWKNAERVLENLRRDGLLSGARFFATSRDRLERRIRPAGFFRAKTQRLRDLARALADRPGGLDGLLSQPLSQARAELLSFSGIGPETADVVLLYAGGRAVFVADAYAKRLAHRLGLFRYNTYAMAQTFFHQRLPRRVPLYREAHALIVAHAKAHCRARPLCAGCPLLTRCPTGARHG